ncbi:hypothetical protein [Streptomyces xinghaiensis]
MLYDATGGIGTTLDVTRTAEELTQVAPPRAVARVERVPSTR